jgi:F-type H+-transporting ATPase subunit b
MEILHTLGIEPKVILIQIIGFLILFFVLKKFLFGRVGEFLEKRREEIKANYDKIENEKKEIEKLKSEYEKHLAKIEDEIKEKIASAVKEGQSIKEEIISEARREAIKIMEKGRKEIEIEKEKVLISLREDIVNLTVTALNRILPEILDEEKHRLLIKDFIENFPEKTPVN